MSKQTRLINELTGAIQVVDRHIADFKAELDKDPYRAMERSDIIFTDLATKRVYTMALDELKRQSDCAPQLTARATYMLAERASFADRRSCPTETLMDRAEMTAYGRLLRLLDRYGHLRD